MADMTQKAIQELYKDQERNIAKWVKSLFVAIHIIALVSLLLGQWLFGLALYVIFLTLYHINKKIDLFRS